jgi:hypothetical protein
MSFQAEQDETPFFPVEVMSFIFPCLLSKQCCKSRRCRQSSSATAQAATPERGSGLRPLPFSVPRRITSSPHPRRQPVRPAERHHLENNFRRPSLGLYTN